MMFESVSQTTAAVDACLSNGLKRRALGLFKTNSTTALLQKVAKNCEVASLVLKKVTEVENADPNKYVNCFHFNVLISI